MISTSLHQYPQSPRYDQADSQKLRAILPLYRRAATPVNHSKSFFTWESCRSAIATSIYQRIVNENIKFEIGIVRLREKDLVDSVIDSVSCVKLGDEPGSRKGPIEVQHQKGKARRNNH